MPSLNSPSKITTLSPREQTILLLIGRAFTDKEIITETGLSQTSIRTYLSRAAGKLGTAGRYQTFLAAKEQKLL